MSPEVDEYFENATAWVAEAEQLREILLDCELEERLKWAKPTYVAEGNNIAIIQKFNDFLALMFFKGALLDDPGQLLEEQGENTRSALRLCFRTVEDVRRAETAIRDFVRQAIVVERKGLSVPKPDLVLVEELQNALDADPALKAAFEALTPGRQRHYNIHISGAKQAKTRVSRVEKCIPTILAGKGLRD